MSCLHSVAPLSKTLPGQAPSSSPQRSLEVSSFLRSELYALAALRADGQGQRSGCSSTWESSDVFKFAYLIRNSRRRPRWPPGLGRPCSGQSGGWTHTPPGSLPGNTRLLSVVQRLRQNQRLQNLTESRYTMTFPGNVSTFLTTLSVWIPSGSRTKPLSRPTSMMAIPVAFRPRPWTRLQGRAEDENRSGVLMWSHSQAVVIQTCSRCSGEQRGSQNQRGPRSGGTPRLHGRPAVSS